MALPAIADVVASVPAGSIDVAARASVAPLFSMTPGVGRTLVLTDAAASVRLLRAGRYDTALLLTNSFNTARLAWKAGIAARWGYRGDFRSVLLTRGIARPDRVHQSDYYRHLVRALGIDSAPAAPQPHLTDDQKNVGRRLLEGEGWDGIAPLVTMAPGAAFGGAKRWPARSFAGLADALADAGVRVVIIGSAGDAGAAAEVLAARRPDVRAINLVGRTDLPTLGSVLVHGRALVTNDSGAMHFAAALGVSVTALFGPTREEETHPVGPGQSVVVTQPVWCRPCMLRECPLTKRCMTGITVDRVLAATRPFLR